MTVEPVLAAVLAGIVFLDVGLSIAVVRSGMYSRPQMYWQLALIWFIPVLGMLLVGMVFWSHWVPGKHFQRGNGADHENWENVDAGRGHSD